MFSEELFIHSCGSCNITCCIMVLSQGSHQEYFQRFFCMLFDTKSAMFSTFRHRHTFRKNSDHGDVIVIVIATLTHYIWWSTGIGGGLLLQGPLKMRNSRFVHIHVCCDSHYSFFHFTWLILIYMYLYLLIIWIFNEV